MPHPTDVHIGHRIRELRLAAGMSQVALGVELGVSFQQAQKYESGANRISGSRIWDLCKVLRVEPNDLFDGLGSVARSPEAQGRTRMVLETVKDLNSLHPTQLQPIRQIIKAVREANDTAKAMPAAE